MKGTNCFRHHIAEVMMCCHELHWKNPLLYLRVGVRDAERVEARQLSEGNQIQRPNGAILWR